MWTTLIGTLGTAVKGFFNLKDKQAETVISAMGVLNNVNATAQARDVAAAQILIAEAQSSSWLTRTWRPLFMVVFMGLLLSYWFGYVPANIEKDMPPVIAEIFELIKLGLIGYIPSRGLEKIATTFKIGNIIEKFVDKKLG